MTKRAHGANPRWLGFLLAALVAALVMLLGAGTASATVAETRVGAPTPVVHVLVGPVGGIGAGQRLGNGLPTYDSALATGVAAEAGVGAARGGEESVQLFRSVNAREFDSVAATGRFSTAPGQMEGKFFATTCEHAEQWGQLLHGGDAVTVETRIPRTLADQLFLREGKLDGVGPAIYANGGQLDLINGLMDGIRLWP